MTEFQVAYIPIGVPTFHLESAQTEFKASCELLLEASKNVVCPKEMLLTMAQLCDYLDTLHPNLIILQNLTFANGAYTSEILKRFSCPILLWTLREPVIDGTRLRLNSLTGAYSAANVLLAFRNGNFEYVYGSAKESSVRSMIQDVIAAAWMKYGLETLHMAAVGQTPQGFGFGRALDTELMQTFGVTLESFEARELMEKANQYSETDCDPYLQETRKCTKGLDEIPKENQIGYAKLYKAYLEFMKEHNIGAFATRCWPDYFTEYHTPVCSVLAMLNEHGIAAACETDIYGALSMYVGMQLSSEAVFFGDPVSMDEAENTITYWHCGTAACSLAHPETGAVIGVHPNRKIGPVMDFGCRACDDVTVFRIGRSPEGTFRFFVMRGAALNRPKQFTGTSVVIKVNGVCKDIVANSIKDGWEPHFCIVYKNIERQLEILARMLGLKPVVYE